MIHGRGERRRFGHLYSERASDGGPGHQQPHMQRLHIITPDVTLDL